MTLLTYKQLIGHTRAIDWLPISIIVCIVSICLFFWFAYLNYKEYVKK